MCSYNFLNIFNNYLGVMSTLELARLPGCLLSRLKHHHPSGRLSCSSWLPLLQALLCLLFLIDIISGSSRLLLPIAHYFSELAICALLCSQQALTSMNSAEKSQAHCQLPSLEAGNCSNIINHKFPACAPYLGLLSSPPLPHPFLASWKGLITFHGTAQPFAFHQENIKQTPDFSWS